MNALPENTEQSTKHQRPSHRRHGRRIVKAALLVPALGLAAWPAWNWVAAPLLALPALTYWQMTGIVALIGAISMIFSGAARHRRPRRPDQTEATCSWSRCFSSNTKQG